VRILVTGGAGYIGSHVCKALAASGFVPVVYDNLSRGHRWAVKWGPLEQGDIADTARVTEVIKRHRPAVLMHFAGYAYVGESVADPLRYYCNNTAATAALLEAVINTRSMPVVFSSTAAIYGIPVAIPISEDHPAAPVNTYGFTKHVIERMLGDADRAYGLKSVSLRYFNAAGADPDADIGEAHHPETHLIPLVLAAARGGTPVNIFGDDYETPDGTCVRDYIHVVDIASAHVAAARYLLEDGASDAFNLANSRGHSVKEVIATAERVTGRPIACEISPRRPGDPDILIGRADRARSVLKWEPQRSALETQMEDAWRWMMRSTAIGRPRHWLSASRQQSDAGHRDAAQRVKAEIRSLAPTL
jgi:UDP-glucose-4-epimerase GalE